MTTTTARTIALALNKFPALPATLTDPATKEPVKALSVAVKALFHHYYLVKYGDDGLDDGIYEYERRLTAGPDWRFLGAGIGADTESKRNVSNELGKAFARWFLDTHFGFTYFCPFKDVLERGNPDGSTWRKHEAGDSPDYVCGKHDRDVNLLEAKGRYSPVSFRTKEFDEFRAQVARVQLIDPQGHALEVKGYVSAARWATEETPRVRSQLLVEDPVTRGAPPGEGGYPRDIGLSMVAGHYAPVFDRLQLRDVAEAIRHLRPYELRATRGLWECVSGPLKGRRFVGGIIPDWFAVPWGPWWPFFDHDEHELRHMWRYIRRASPFFLTRPPLFFGVEEAVFTAVMGVARGGLASARQIEAVNVPERTGSLSLLRDGSVLGSADYFEPVGVKDV